MTTSEATFLDEWTTHPLGKTVRVAIAVVGLATATVVLLRATLTTDAVGFMVVLGASLAAASIRAALRPSMARLAILTAVLVVIPIAGRLI